MPNDRDDRQAPSPVAAERLGPALPGITFWVGAAAVAITTATILLVAGGGLAETRAERAAYQSESPFGGLADAFGLDVMRVFAVGATALGTLALAWAGSRLLHSPLAGVFAAAVAMLDTGLLATGHLALPYAFLFLAGAASLALALTNSVVAHWLVIIPVSAGIALDPWFLLWGLALAVAMSARGHIYSAPRHVAIAGSQAVLAPAIIGGIWWAIAGQETEVCGAPGWFDRLTLAIAYDTGGPVILHNPIFWFAGLGAVTLLGVGGVGVVASRFRMMRTPGRLQFRLPVMLAPAHARSIWIVVLFAAAMQPFLWIIVFALALAHGARLLGQDSPAFAWPVHGAVLAFLVIYVVRLWAAVTGTGDVAAPLVWTDVVRCP